VVTTCNAVLSGVAAGCQYQGFNSPIDGITWTMSQGGATIGSGTTHSGGVIDAVTTQSTATVTMSWSGLPPRALVADYTVGPVCHSTVADGFFIAPSGTGAWVCIAQRPSQANYCLLPIATTLYLTSPFSGALIALAYSTSGILWSGAESYGLSPNPCSAGVTPDVAYIYYPDVGQLQVSYRCGAGGFVSIGTATMTHICPTLAGGAYSASGTLSTSYGGGPVPISE
jgi:hypothetical protein